MVRIPLGKRESQTLEFKSGEALDSPDSIARALVAMLNANGGEIWIGVRELEGRAAAVDGVKEPEKAVRSLRDLFIDTIEPSPLGDEVKVEQVAARDGVVLVVRVNPKKSSKPYAQRRRNARLFVVRVEDRIRPMSRPEIVEQLTNANAVGDSPFGNAPALFERRMDDHGGFFAIGVQPLGSINLDVQEPQLRVLLSDPAATGNRSAGWNFLYPANPTVAKDRIELGDRDHRLTCVYEDGGVYFRAGLESLIVNTRPAPSCRFPPDRGGFPHQGGKPCRERRPPNCATPSPASAGAASPRVAATRPIFVSRS